VECLVIPQFSDNLAAAHPTVGTNGTRTLPFLRGHAIDSGSLGAHENWRVILRTELNIDEVLLPADWAIPNVLLAH
jgi:hypothetical protein